MIRYSLATPDDDSALRSLLRDNPMPSWVNLVTTREPSFFVGNDSFWHDWAVIARENDNVVGMYTCAEHTVHLNGAAARLNYLGGLRVSPSYRYRMHVLRKGYASIRVFSKKTNPELWLTAIASENTTARRLLEANLPGMPRYRAVNEMLTLALPTARGRRRGCWRPARADELEAACLFHNHNARHHQFSPVLTPEHARRTEALFHVVDGNDGIDGVMALWNQQPYKQVMASAYRFPLESLLPLYNLYARWARKVVLPSVGQVLDQSYLAFLETDLRRDPCPLIEDALSICPTRVMTLGLHAGHAWLDPLIHAFRPATYRTGIYTVDFGESFELDGRPAQPEVALL